jgi:enoyl-CoA hydratase/3-hydroxyacyl-CoA dehydrogenase
MTAPKKIGVVGAGTMGAGIAQKIAQSGLSVVLMDMGEAQVQAGLDRIRSMLEEGVKRKVFRPGAVEDILGRIRPTTQAADMADCDLIVEAVFEDLKIKRSIFSELEKHVRPEAVLATNTSSFKVAAIAEGANRPERVIGLHYFFHPAKNRLVEVIPHGQSSKASMERAWAFAEATGKTAIHSEDAPGFVVNRFFVPWLIQSVRLLEEGVADLLTIEDTAKKLFGIGMGPFQLMNVTGVPIAMHAAEGLASELGPFYKAAGLLRDQVAKQENWSLEGVASGAGGKIVEQRLLGVVLLVAAALVQEGVSSPVDTEIGAKVGLRWPLGPFSLANKKGVNNAVAWAAEVARKYDLPLPEILASRLENPVPFDLPSVNLSVEEGVARITMNRPEALNALDPETVSSLAKAFEQAECDPQVNAIVIEGRGKAFVAGADIKFFIQGIDDGDIDRIVDFTRAGHELFYKIDACKKPVVARLNGLALGGGAELALACDAIVADESAALGFPETGIGIYPGLGGTQRLAKRCGLEVARYLVLTGDIVPAAKAAGLGLVDKVAKAGTSMTQVLELLDSGVVKAFDGDSGLARPNDAKRKAQALFTAENTAALLAGTFEPMDDYSAKVSKKIATKAPVALRLADELMSQALGTPMKEGIALELAALPKIFKTKDARLGLGSVGKGRPEFKGE